MLAASVTPFSLLQSLTVPTLPTIQREYGADQPTTAWLLTGFLLTSAVATPVLGRLGDSYGKRRVLVVALAALLAGSLMAALAPTMKWMIVARVIQGVGGGSLPLSFGIIRDELPDDRIASGIGLISGLLAGGFGLGIVISGPVVEHFGIHWLFLLPAIVAVGAVVAVLRLVPESPVRTRQRIPLVPALLLAVWLSALLIGISGAPSHGWGSPYVIALVGVGVVVLIGWVFLELHLTIPLIDLRLMTLRAVWTANVVAFLTGMALYGSHGFIPQFTQTATDSGYGFGSNVTEAGHMMLPAAAATLVCGVYAARAAAVVGSRNLVAIGCTTATVSLLLVALVHDVPALMYVWTGLGGLGTGLVFACVASAIVAAVPQEHTGVAAGTNTNFRTLGGACGTALTASILSGYGTASGVPAEQGYTTAFLVLAGAVLVAAVLACFMPSPRPIRRSRP
ncbi:MFS transporter [Nocardioides hwasunensis]|uniref:MFS transporter n=1 Tax=Nocardioides hwasunensis TaxID=397258 RepID=A0ABR8MGM9_9ACTN|nr:MFS transporter [Nocardioides hwasunensis]MBD3915048.1 MFS transporter [Nocardioides hwasunensis]